MTTVRIGMIRKKHDWGVEQFQHHWLENHGPLAAQVPGLQSYWQNVVTERMQRGITFARGPWNFDGFSQLTLDPAAPAEQPFAQGSLAQALIRDEKHFLDGLHILTAESNAVIEPPGEAVRGKLLKRISLLRRVEGSTEIDFRREWQLHADFVRAMPGVRGYRQNVVTSRARTKGEWCGYDELPIDGMVELWFETPETLEAAFGSPEGKFTMEHAQTFLGEITAFAVQERRIV